MGRAKTSQKKNAKKGSPRTLRVVCFWMGVFPLKIDEIWIDGVSQHAKTLHTLVPCRHEIEMTTERDNEICKDTKKWTLQSTLDSRVKSRVKNRVED